MAHSTPVGHIYCVVNAKLQLCNSSECNSSARAETKEPRPACRVELDGMYGEGGWVQGGLGWPAERVI